MVKVLAFDRGDVCASYDLTRFDTFLIQNWYDPQKEWDYFKKNKWNFDRGKITEPQFRSWLKKALGFEESIETLIQNNMKNLIIDRKLLKFIATLRKKYTTILRSNNDKTSITQIRKEIQLKDFFDAIYFSCEYKAWKIEDSVVNHIKKKYKCVPSDIVFIDDKACNIVPLKKKWYQGIIYTDIENLKTELRKLWVK